MVHRQRISTEAQKLTLLGQVENNMNVYTHSREVVA